MRYPIIKSTGLDNDMFKTHELWTYCTLLSAAADTGVRGYTDTQDANLYLEIGGVQPSSALAATSVSYIADAGATLPTLDSNAAPAIIGAVIYSYDFDQFVIQEVPTALIVSATMSAGVVSKRGASTTGISITYNGCTSISCTGLDLDSGVATSTFYLHTIWKSRLAV